MKIIGEHLPQFSVVNIAAALHRVAKHSITSCDIKQDVCFWHLLRYVEETLDVRDRHVQPQEIASMAWALSKLGFNHSPLLQSLSAPSLRRLKAFRPQHLSNPSWSISSLHYQHRPLLHALA